ncbi:MAG: peptidoglycan DD-metalloendopeptidase family protein [Alphaproteobacteria bacterium]|nr:peptidoglycan DD-metalloendopeptidase family protein [Alphaproteobacteria bacterium]
MAPSLFDIFFYGWSLRILRIRLMQCALGLLCVTVFLPLLFSSAGSKNYYAADVAEPSILSEVIPTPPEPTVPLQEEHLSIEVGKGDILADMLAEHGVDKAEAYAALEALHGVYNPKSLKIGQSLQLHRVPDTDGKKLVFSELVLRPQPEREVRVTRAPDGTFHAASADIPLTRKVSFATGRIESSLMESTASAGIPAALAMQMIDAYSYDVDFQREMQPGNMFNVLYEQYYDEAGNHVYDGDIVYAGLKLDDRDLTIYRYTRDNGETSYYTADGRSVRKGLMRTPINGARISSGYGLRKHPILGYTKMHRGLDFAAATGTPIFAAGNGTVDFVGKRGGYGNYVRIRHSNTKYSTAYAHMQRFAKGMRKGKSVKQGDIIGYVGTSGRSTGPHLHYEVLANSTQVDPKVIKNLASVELGGKELASFRQHRDQLDAAYAQLSARKMNLASAAQ